MKKLKLGYNFDKFSKRKVVWKTVSIQCYEWLIIFNNNIWLFFWEIWELNANILLKENWCLPEVNLISVTIHLNKGIGVNANSWVLHKSNQIKDEWLK